MAKKATGKTAPKKKAAPKAAQSATTPKKAATTKASAVPGWLKPLPIDYIVGTEDYAALVGDHNEKFGTMYNKWRVQPQVFYTIHARITSHYNDKG